VFDSRSEASEFVGASREEAVGKACRFFGRDASELVIAELGETVSGAGGRVIVVAQPVGARPPRSGGRDEGPRERRERRPERGDRERRPERGDRGERGGRPGRGERFGEREPAPAPAPAAEPAQDLGPEEESVGTPVGTLQAIGSFIQGALERMALGPFEIRESEEPDFVVYQLRGPAAERLAGGEGRATDALQLVANQAALRISEEHKRVVIDVEGERADREDFLGRAAQRAAKRAQETGRAVALDPMNPRDRRGIHVALRDTPGIATMSIGSGRYRQVLVVPEGAPEYEEARRSAAASPSDA
jgi:predicted RNA-binding protein Jag